MGSRGKLPTRCGAARGNRVARCAPRPRRAAPFPKSLEGSRSPRPQPLSPSLGARGSRAAFGAPTSTADPSLGGLQPGPRPPLSLEDFSGRRSQSTSPQSAGSGPFAVGSPARRAGPPPGSVRCKPQRNRKRDPPRQRALDIPVPPGCVLGQAARWWRPHEPSCPRDAGDPLRRKAAPRTEASTPGRFPGHSARGTETCGRNSWSKPRLAVARQREKGGRVGAHLSP